MSSYLSEGTSCLLTVRSLYWQTVILSYVSPVCQKSLDCLVNVLKVRFASHVIPP
jgi:hypothetical protein